MQIEVFNYAPFRSRTDTVIGLRNKYDLRVRNTIVATLRPLHYRLNDADAHVHTAGGWLPERKAWFIEREAWPAVAQALFHIGAQFVPGQPPPGTGGGPEPLPVPGPCDCLQCCAWNVALTEVQPLASTPPSVLMRLPAAVWDHFIAAVNAEVWR